MGKKAMFEVFKNKSLVLRIMFIFLILFWLAFCWPRIQLINKLHNRLADLEVLTETNFELVGKMADFEKFMTRMEMKSLYLSQRLEKKYDASVFLNELSRISTLHNLEVVNIKDVDHKVKKQIDSIKEMAVYLEVKGRFFLLGEFFKDLQESSLLASINSLEIEADKKDYPNIKAKMKIIIYVLE